MEVATFRSDVGYSDGRHPDRVVYAKSPQEDVRRRDFTINALLLDPDTNEVLDFVGGRDDLNAGIIRAIGHPEERFREDKLRMVRAVRFAARFGYAIEPTTFEAIQKLAPEIHQVSAERLRDELTKLLTEGAARRGFELLDESRLLPELLAGNFADEGRRTAAAISSRGRRLDSHADDARRIAGRLLAHARLGRSAARRGQAADVHATCRARMAGFDSIEHVEVGTRMAEEICRRLRFSNEDTAQIAALVANHLRFKDVPQMKPATLKRFVRLDRFEEHLELHRLDCLSSHRNLDNYDLCPEISGGDAAGGGQAAPADHRRRSEGAGLSARTSIQGDSARQLRMRNSTARSAREKMPCGWSQMRIRPQNRRM